VKRREGGRENDGRELCVVGWGEEGKGKEQRTNDVGDKLRLPDWLLHHGLHAGHAWGLLKLAGWRQECRCQVGARQVQAQRDKEVARHHHKVPGLQEKRTGRALSLLPTCSSNGSTSPSSVQQALRPRYFGKAPASPPSLSTGRNDAARIMQLIICTSTL
jgi:hypothetical protein